MRRRLRPPSTTQLVAPVAGGGKLPDDVPPGPIRIDVESTDSEGGLAKWFGDDWFAELIRRFGDDFVTLHIAPTPEALLHPCVVYEAEMLRRVVPHWRVVITAYLSDVQTLEAAKAVAETPYHELRVLDETRPRTVTAERMGLGLSLTDLFGGLRREKRTASGRMPVLVRLPSRDRAEPPAGDHRMSGTPIAGRTIH